MTEYDAQFFADISAGSRSSAEVISPKFHDLVKPTSVVDVGCGKGWFLAEFIKLGVTDILGIDGGPAEDLVIPDSNYKQTDLSGHVPLVAPRRFDLALCLEVGEHLPETSADSLIDYLCALSPVVLFSAAVPMQGGHGHVNERWIDYWAAKFQARSYMGSGWPRLDMWDDERVAAFYRQNICLYVDRNFIGENTKNWDLRHYMETTPAFSMYRFIHPYNWGERLGVRFL